MLSFKLWGFFNHSEKVKLCKNLCPTNTSFPEQRWSDWLAEETDKDDSRTKSPGNHLNRSPRFSSINVTPNIPGSLNNFSCQRLIYFLWILSSAAASQQNLINSPLVKGFPCLFNKGTTQNREAIPL